MAMSVIVSTIIPINDQLYIERPVNEFTVKKTIKQLPIHLDSLKEDGVFLKENVSSQPYTSVKQANPIK